MSRQDVIHALEQFRPGCPLPAYAAELLRIVELEIRVRRYRVPKVLLEQARHRVNDSEYLAVEVPLPEDRICQIHGIPISPARWRGGHRKKGCAQCRQNYPSKQRDNIQRSVARSVKNRARYGVTPRSLNAGQIFERITGLRVLPERARAEKDRPAAVKPAAVRAFERTTGMKFSE